MAKGSKRQRKKQLKRKQEQVLSRQYSPKEIKRLSTTERTSETKRITRNDARKQSRQATKTFFQNEGFSTQFINRYRLYDRKIDSYSAADILRLRKMEELERNGYTYTQGDLRLGWAKLRNKYPSISIPDAAEKQYQKQIENTTFICKEFLYIGAAEIRHDLMLEDFSHLSSDEIAALISDRVQEAKDHPEDSSQLVCAFAYDHGSRETMALKANAYYKRGYDLSPDHTKFDARSYSKLTVSNRWKQHDFLSMVLNVTNQMKNSDVASFISEMRGYCRRNNLPFMDKVK